MHTSYDDLVRGLKRMLPTRRLTFLARAVRFIRRLRTLRADVFMWALVLSRFAPGRPGFEEARRWYHRLAGKWIAPRPFQLRFKSAAVVELCQRAFAAAVAPWRARGTSRHPLARQFADVVAIDSTVMLLAPELQGHFPGLRRIAAQLKVTLAVSLFGLVPLHAQVGGARRNDMTLFPPLSLFRAGSLLLFDLGFVVYARLRELTQAQLSYVCRLRANGNALIVGGRGLPAVLRRRLRDQPNGVCLRHVLPCAQRITRRWDLDVLLRPDDDRTHRVPARLVIVPGPQHEQRAYLTNLRAAPWTPAAVAELYRLRWQIELVNKELKQHLQLECLPSKDPQAVQAFAWASLLALALSRSVAACLCHLRSLIGLSGSLRPMTLTRAVRACLRILGKVLTAPAKARPVLAAVFLTEVEAEARTLHPEREDSVRRLCRMLCRTEAA